MTGSAASFGFRRSFGTFSSLIKATLTIFAEVGNKNFGRFTRKIACFKYGIQSNHVFQSSVSFRAGASVVHHTQPIATTWNGKRNQRTNGEKSKPGICP